MMLITLIFSRFFHSNFIIQYLLFSTFLSYCTMLLYVMGSCKCRRGLSDPWNTCLYCSYCFSVFSDCLCFQNKLMMMMMMKNQRCAPRDKCAILTDIRRFRLNSVFNHRLNAVVNEDVLKLHGATKHRRTIQIHDTEQSLHDIRLRFKASYDHHHRVASLGPNLQNFVKMHLRKCYDRVTNSFVNFSFLKPVRLLFVTLLIKQSANIHTNI